jgi:hypothetical protein
MKSDLQSESLIIGGSARDMAGHETVGKVVPAGPTLFNYAVMFGDRREWVARDAIRPLRFDAQRTTGRKSGITARPIEKPLGTAWTDLACLKDGDRDGARRLIEEWGLDGFAHVVYMWAREKAADVYPQPVGLWRQSTVGPVKESYDAAADAIGHILFQLAAHFRMAATVLLLRDPWSPNVNGDEGEPSWRLLRKVLEKRPSGRLAVLSVLRTLPESARGLDVASYKIMRSLEVLARPAEPIEEEALVPPIVYARPSDGRSRSSEARFRSAIRDTPPHTVVYYTDSFLALCWREFWYAVEHDIVYRRCGDSTSTCRRFLVVDKNRTYCAVCQAQRRDLTPRRRLIERLVKRGYPPEKAAATVQAYRKLEQQRIRSGGRVSSRHRWEALRKELGIRG